MTVRTEHAYWAICDLDTGYFLPAREGRGHTWEEPVPAWVQPPRLWVNRAGAARALGWWKKGRTSKKVSRFTGPDAPLVGEEVWEERVTEPAPERSGRSMEVVEIRLYARPLVQSLKAKC